MGVALTMGRLARKAGVNVETVRYDQRIGLVAAPGKPAEGYRTYAPKVVEGITVPRAGRGAGLMASGSHDGAP